MCGIVGVININRSNLVDNLEIKKAIDLITHRGPDGFGIYTSNNVGLGHRRLSIIDLSTGNQPMTDGKSNITVVFNGEIYNYQELQKELITLGHVFESKSDTEVILKSYMQWGQNCVNHFNGMWAFIIHDPNIDLIFASRDRLGEKPLHIYRDTEKIILSSEIKSILSFKNVKTDWNYEMLDIYLALGYIPAPYSFYKGIEKLPPGYNLQIKSGKFSTYKYWELPELDEREFLKDRDFVYEKFQFLFEDSIRLRMRSDVPFGAFLSGGLDSSAVVSVMSKFTKLPIETFTIGFNEPEFDERELAYDVAKKFGTNHNVNVLDVGTFEKSLQRVLFHYDEPFGDSSAIPTDFVSNYASQKVKMVLTGDGGDEVLSGYPAYQFEKMVKYGRHIPNNMKKFSAQLLSNVGNITHGIQGHTLSRFANALEASSLSFNDRLTKRVAWAKTKERNTLIRNNDVYAFDDYISDFMKKCRYKDDFYKMMYFNTKLTLPEDMLTKVDRMSMANSLETRVPFLDYRLVEFMSTVDKSIKMNGLERKSVLRNTVGKTLPPSVLKGSKKGFVTPLREWFKTDDVISLLKKNINSAEGLIDVEFVNQLIKENKSGASDNGNLLWMLSILSARLSTKN